MQENYGVYFLREEVIFTGEVMVCKEGMDIYECPCHGMHLFRDEMIVVIDKDSCYNGCYKVLNRKTRTFPDNSSLIDDEILICGDKNILIGIADAVRKEFD